MKSPIIKMQNLYKSFPQGDEFINVLQDINITIETGDFVAIVGQSGSGKSTLMNILGCLDTPTSGTYEVYGTEINELESDELAKLRCKHFGFIFQKYQLISGLTAVENVAMPAIYSGMSAADRTKRAIELLTQFGLEQRLDYTPGKLSGGQQQRVSIARALMNGGKIIFADEPTGALDSKSGGEVMKILHTLNQQGHTIIMVTHDPALAQQAKRIIEIKDGKIIHDKRNSPIVSSSTNHTPTEKKLILIGAILGSLKENYKMAVRAILYNKFRAILTMLGIIFGIASVVCMVSIGNGTLAKIMDKLGAATARTIYIYTGDKFKVRSLKIPTQPLNDHDLQYLKTLPYLKYVMPSIHSDGVIQYSNHAVNAQLHGCDIDCIVAADLTLIKGSSFNKNLIEQNSLVAMIDENIAKELFPDGNALGKIVLIYRIPIRIMGIVKHKSNFGQQYGQAYIPHTTLAGRMNGTYDEYHGFSMVVKTGYAISDVKEKIEKYFYTKHNHNKDFEIYALDDEVKKFTATADGIKMFIIIVASIALLVGGIGVMNIMLVSVTERTPEIGIRMAVGAKQIDIRQQFLIESIILCLFGGCIGIVLAFLLGGIIKVALDTPDSIVGFEFSLASVIIAVFFSTMIGIIFGYIPAKNASRLNPVEALLRE